MKADGLDPLPTYTPPGEDPQTRPELAARYPLQLLSPPRPQFLNSTFANSPRHRARRGRSDRRAVRRGRRAAWPRRRRLGRGLQRPRPFQARVALTGSVRPGVAVATGIYWNKLVPGGSNVNSTSSSALTDMGGGATFFDNLVEVRRVNDR